MVWFEAQPWDCTHLRCWWLLVTAGPMSPSWHGYQMVKIFQYSNTGLKTEKFEFYEIQMLEKIE